MPYFIASYLWNAVTNIDESLITDCREDIYVHPSGMLICATILAEDIENAMEIAEAIGKKYKQLMRDK